MEELSTLVVAAQHGDHEAFAKIVARFQNMAYAGAYAMVGNACLAQDAAQEAFIDAYLSLGNLREPAAFPGWFRRILIKHSDRQIRGKRMMTVPLDEAMQLLPPSLDPAVVVEARQVQQTVHQAIAALPQDQRLVISLFYVKGYSQKEIAQFLELPVTTIKKRLYTARQRLKERMIIMVKEHLQEHKPSQNDQFANKVQFFIALRTNDLDQIKKLVAKDPGLIDIRTTWDVSSQGYYWPLGITPLFWAASTGNIELATFLLSLKADINATDPAGATPLHHAVHLQQPALVDLLLKHGAGIDVKTKAGQTPLHLAVLRNNRQIIELLLTHNAHLDLPDNYGYTPVDWALMKGYTPLVELLVAHGAPQPAAALDQPAQAAPPKPSRQVPVSKALMGRLIDGSGQPLDDRPLADVSTQPIYRSLADTASPILETRIKIIDLLAPIKQGGHIGLFSPLSGVGVTLTLSDLIYSIATFHHGYIVYLGLEEGDYTAKSLVQGWRGECGLPEHILIERMVHIFGKSNDPLKKKQQLAETGLTVAEDIRRQGHEVLLVVDERLARVEEIVRYLKANVASTAEAAITVLYKGDYTAGLEPPPFAELDAVITFSMERALQKLSPAIDPLRSRSHLLRADLIGETQFQTTSQARNLLLRYHDLHYQVERYGLSSLWYLQDREAEERLAIRARRLHRFLTQPLNSAEAWANIKLMEGLIGIPAQYVKLEDTLQGCRAILDGEYDSLPEEAFYFIGPIDQAVKKAEQLR
jgi:F-type H+-transporting ATPase subunit beta